MFSTGSMSNSDNPVSQVKMNIGLKRYPDIYHAEYEKAVSSIYPEAKWYELESQYTSISNLALTQRAEYRNELQSIVMYPTSGDVWSISPPAWQTLAQDMKGDSNIELVLSYTFLLGLTGKEVFASSVHALTDAEKLNFAKVLDGNITGEKSERRKRHVSICNLSIANISDAFALCRVRGRGPRAAVL